MMEDELIFCCELTDISPNSETATEFLSIFDYNFSSFFDNEKKTLKHVLYFNNIKSANLAVANLAEIPPEWNETGLRFSNINVFSIEKKDWSEVWKKHFTIQHITDKLTIKPTWLEYSRRYENEIIIEIDPGMSFGTGRHATTRFCLKIMAEIPQKNKASFLDAGCGSGILTIAAHKLGFTKISAFDYDSGCITCTEENLQVNNIIPEKMNLFTADIANLAENDRYIGKYDLVVANILAHILYKNRKTIFSFLKPDSYLILAGIQTEEYPKIRDAFLELGLNEIKNITEDEWTGGVFYRGYASCGSAHE